MSSNLPGGSTEPTVSTTGSGVRNNQQNPMRRSPTIPVWVGWIKPLSNYLYLDVLSVFRQRKTTSQPNSPTFSRRTPYTHLSHLLGSWPSALVGDQPQRDQLLCGPPAVGQWKPGDFLQHMQISHKFSDLLQRCLGVSRAFSFRMGGRGMTSVCWFGLPDHGSVPPQFQFSRTAQMRQGPGWTEYLTFIWSSILRPGPWL